jgi:hypothetical protein
MSRNPTFRPFIDEVRTISITDLKHWGYLQPNQFKSGIIRWYIEEREYKKYTSNIKISVNTFSNHC